MEAKKGIWTIKQGKTNRVYVVCDDQEKIMHPHQLCEMNGLGIYGIEHLHDLAMAILKFEKKNYFSGGE